MQIRQTGNSQPNNRLRSMNSATTLILKPTSPTIKPTLCETPIHHTPRSTHIRTLSTPNQNNLHQYLSNNTKAQPNIEKTGIPHSHTSPTITTHITHLDNLNKQLLKIIDRMHQTTPFKHNIPIHYSSSSHLLQQTQILSFQQQISNKFTQFVNDLHKHYRKVDHQIRNFAQTVLKQDYHSPQNVLLKNIKCNQVIRQTSKGDERFDTNMSKVGNSECLSNRIRELQANLQTSKLNESKLINIIEVLVQDKESKGANSINKGIDGNQNQAMHKQRFISTYGNTHEKLPQSRSQLVMLTTEHERVGINATSGISINGVSRYEESIPSSVEHLKIFDQNPSYFSQKNNQNPSYISQKNNSSSKVYIQTQSSNKKSKVQTNLQTSKSKKSLRPLHPKSDESMRHRMQYLLNNLHQ